MEPAKSLVERLGYDADARLLIINCDDVGSSHAANLACHEAMTAGVATSAPSPYSPGGSERQRTSTCADTGAPSMVVMALGKLLDRTPVPANIPPLNPAGRGRRGL